MAAEKHTCGRPNAQCSNAHSSPRTRKESHHSAQSCTIACHLPSKLRAAHRLWSRVHQDGCCTSLCLQKSVSRHGPGAQVLADANASHQRRLNYWRKLLHGHANYHTAEPTTTLGTSAQLEHLVLCAHPWRPTPFSHAATAAAQDTGALTPWHTKI
jgi:hypothetical protein